RSNESCSVLLIRYCGPSVVVRISIGSLVLTGFADSIHTVAELPQRVHDLRLQGNPGEVVLTPQVQYDLESIDRRVDPLAEVHFDGLVLVGHRLDLCLARRIQSRLAG